MTMDHPNSMIGGPTSCPMRATISYTPQTTPSTALRTLRSPAPTPSSSPTLAPVAVAPIPGTAVDPLTGITNTIAGALSLRNHETGTTVLSPTKSPGDRSRSEVTGTNLNDLALDLVQKHSQEERSTSSSSSINLDNTLALRSSERKMPFLDFRPVNCSTIRDSDVDDEDGHAYSWIFLAEYAKITRPGSITVSMRVMGVPDFSRYVSETRPLRPT
ncbi:hypothetical protein FGIG_03604 [Fasciola gigantica]|uniref:Uncharacterized protein n=1 Tax=Fasciola gigantica TaxID=46835 RepID=A0A504Y7H8_FASGI|nr:hypothetical protein FGIG_03604 [Fasciola gigantica]